MKANELNLEIKIVETTQALLNEEAAATFLGLTPRCLQNWRWQGSGPPFLRLSSRAVRYDPVALSKGLTVRGHPAVWAMYKTRVYLFRDMANLRAWRKTREKIITQAQVNWPRLGGNLPGTSEW